MEISPLVGAPQNPRTLAGRKPFHRNSLRPLLPLPAMSTAPVVLSAPMWPANLDDLVGRLSANMPRLGILTPLSTFHGTRGVGGSDGVVAFGAQPAEDAARDAPFDATQGFGM